MAVKVGQGGRLQRGKWTDDAMAFGGLAEPRPLKGTLRKTKADGELRFGPCLFFFFFFFLVFFFSPPHFEYRKSGGAPHSNIPPKVSLLDVILEQGLILGPCPERVSRAGKGRGSSLCSLGESPVDALGILCLLHSFPSSENQTGRTSSTGKLSHLMI